MTTLYTLRATASDLAGASAEWNRDLVEGTNTLGTETFNAHHSGPNHYYAFTEAGVPAGDGITGDYDVPIFIVAGDTTSQVRVRLARVNASGAVQAESGFTANQTLAAGLQTHTFTNLDLGTWGSGDRLRIHYEVSRSSGMGSSTATVRTGDDTGVLAPWTVSGGDPVTITAGPATLSVVAQPSEVAEEPLDFDTADFQGLRAPRHVVRAANDNLYIVAHAFISGEGHFVTVFKSTDEGASWTELDPGNRPQADSGFHGKDVGIASDGNLHIAWASGGSAVRYVVFDIAAETYGTVEETTFSAVGGEVDQATLVLDSSDVPHIAAHGFNDSDGRRAVSYRNRVGGAWNSMVTLDASPSAQSGTPPSITINTDNIPVIVYVWGGQLVARLGEANNATSFERVEVTSAKNGTSSRPSVVMDAADVWIAYVAATDDFLRVVQHVSTDPWTTWQASVTDSNVAFDPSAGSHEGRIVVLYRKSLAASNVARNDYNGEWRGEEILHVGDFVNVPSVRWQPFNNVSPGERGFDYVYRTSVTPPRIRYGNFSVVESVAVQAQPATLTASAQPASPQLAGGAVSAQPATLTASAQAASPTLSATSISAQPASPTVAAQSASPQAVVAEYHVFRRSPATGSPFDPNVDTPIAVVPKATWEASGYDDEGLADGIHEWQVFAFDGTEFSSGSNLVTGEVSAAGGVTIQGQPATLTATAQPTSPQRAALTVSSAAATLDATAQSASPQVSDEPVSVNAQPATLAVSAHPATAQAQPAAIAGQPAIASTAAQPVDPQPAPLVIQAQPAELAGAAQGVSPQSQAASTQAAPASMSVQAGEVSPGVAAAIEASPALLASQAQAPSPVSAPAVVSAASADLAASGQAVAPTLAPVVVQATPASMGVASQAVTPVLESKSVAASPASVAATARAVQPVASDQPKVVQTDPAVVGTQAQAVATDQGALEVVTDPAAIGISAGAVSVIRQPVSVQAVPAGVGIQASAIDAVAGAVAVAASPAAIESSAQAAAPLGGSVTIALAPASVGLSAAVPSPELAALAVMASSAALATLASVADEVAASTAVQADAAVLAAAAQPAVVVAADAAVVVVLEPAVAGTSAGVAKVSSGLLRNITISIAPPTLSTLVQGGAVRPRGAEPGEALLVAAGPSVASTVQEPIRRVRTAEGGALTLEAAEPATVPRTIGEPEL